MSLSEFVEIDLAPLLSVMFTAFSSSLLGGWLVLRKSSLVSDAISHSVLPGIVCAFLLSGTRAPMPIFIGALLSAFFAVLLIEIISSSPRLDKNTGMGVVFSVFFALGVVLLERASARNVDLDFDCVINGQLETIYWNLDPKAGFLQLLSSMPPEVLASGSIALLSLLFVALFYRRLVISSFDRDIAHTLGLHPDICGAMLLLFVALSVVAAFRIVGSVLVIALIVSPAATARLYADTVPLHLALSVTFGLLCSVVGYFAGAFVPQWVGLNYSVSASGSIAVCLGVVFALSVVFSPKYGIVGKVFRRLRLSLNIAREDLLGRLVRMEEGEETSLAVRVCVRSLLDIGAVLAGFVRGEVSLKKGAISLTAKGRKVGLSLLRSHRLWEHYLESRLGVEKGSLHRSADFLEHFEGNRLSQEIAREEGDPSIDPHGKPIPPES